MSIIIIGTGVFAEELKTYISEVSSSIAVTLVGKGQPYDNTTAMSIMGSGIPSIKIAMLSEIKAPYYTFIHKTAYVSRTAKIGAGTTIAPNATIAPFAELGQHVLVNYNATVGHNTVIKDLSVVSPTAAIGGNCIIGKSVYVGAGALIKEKVSIGDNTTIGMGSVVLSNIPANSIVVGNPALVFSIEEWPYVSKKLSIQAKMLVESLKLIDQ